MPFKYYIYLSIDRTNYSSRFCPQRCKAEKHHSFQHGKASCFDLSPAMKALNMPVHSCSVNTRYFNGLTVLFQFLLLSSARYNL